MNDQEIERQRLQQLHDSLPPKLPDVPSYLLELNRNQKKLTEIRMHRANEKEMPELEKRYQGQVLENFKKALIELDTLHKKSVI